MSNVERVQQMYAAFGRGDLPALLTMLADKVTWDVDGPLSVPFFGHRQGKGQVAEFFQALATHLDFQEFSPRDFVAQDNCVVVLGFERSTVKATNKAFQSHWTHHFVFADGQVVAFREYTDTSAMAEAMSPKR